jgi:hypothetical protein
MRPDRLEISSESIAFFFGGSAKPAVEYRPEHISDPAGLRRRVEGFVSLPARSIKRIRFIGQPDRVGAKC